MVQFDNKTRPKKEDKGKKRNTFDNIKAFYEDLELTLNALKSEILPIKEKQGKGLKILSLKQMIQRLPIALAQLNAGKTSENLLNEISQIIYLLYATKEITKNIYNNIVNSITL